ncbi:hypothetical protein ACKKBG_A34230 [Auxenochlorella protothecoides x Auxenochlorella symbiontica]
MAMLYVGARTGLALRGRICSTTPLPRVCRMQPGYKRQHSNECDVRVSAISPEAALAVSQQAVIYVAVLGGEAAYNGFSISAGTPGRPSIGWTLVGTAGLTTTAALLQAVPLQTIGSAAGLAISGAVLFYFIKRIQSTPYNDREWPGARAWPATMSLLTFFILAAYAQALASSITS